MPDPQTEHDRPRPCVVVGFDGSPSSHAALHVAGRHAGPGGLVVAVHGYAPPSDFVGAPMYDRVLGEHIARGEALLRDIDTAVLAGAELETDLVAAPPAEALARAARARGAQEIVVGTRGFGRARALLGSVAHELIHLAEVPVTVIPERAVGSRPQADGGRTAAAIGG